MTEVHQFYDEQPKAKRLETWNIVELIDWQTTRIHAYEDADTAVREFVARAEERGFTPEMIDRWRRNVITLLCQDNYLIRMQKSETKFEPVKFR